MIGSDSRPGKPLRVGVVVAGGGVPRWQEELLSSLDALDGAEVQRLSGAPAEQRPWLWALAAARSPGSRLVPSRRPAIAVGPTLPEPGSWDVVVDLAGSCPESWSAGSRLGLWSLVDDRGLALSAAFPAAASVAAGDGGELRVVRERNGRRDCLRRARICLGPHYPQALERLYAEGALLVRQAILDAINDASQPVPTAISRAAPESSIRSSARLLRGACHAAFRRLRRITLEESWMIGIIDRPIGSMVDGPPTPPIRWLGRHQRARYVADPFGVPGDATRLYCEELDHRRGVGVIKELTIDGDRVVRERPVPFPSPGHLSYPYLLSEGGVVYCVPEASASRNCRLYRLDGDGAWRPVATLLSGVAAADPTIFRWEDRYWLAYTDVDRGPFDSLSLCYADRLTGPWQPHANNPVKVDHASARPAGTPFVHEGALYRPAQSCLPWYGGAVALNRVVCCTPVAFREETVRVISPARDGVNPDGLHTVSSWGQRTLVDGKRMMVNPGVLARKLSRRLARTTVALRGGRGAS
jgi:hypothetical protein